MKSRFFAAALLSAVSTASAESVFLDQRHDQPDAFEAYHNIASHVPLGQEFVPTLGVIDFVDLWTHDIGPHGNGQGVKLELRLRRDSLDGEIVAVSRVLELPDGADEPARFEFPDWVPLEIGARYMLELVHIEGDAWAVRGHGDLYPPYDQGRYFLLGEPTTGLDMWFRTGVRQGPVALSLDADGWLRWPGIPPLEYGVWESGDLSTWNERGRVSAETIEHAFESGPAADRPRFFRITPPEASPHPESAA